MLDKSRHGVDLVVALSGGHGLSSPVHPHYPLEKPRSLSSDSDGWGCGQLRWVNRASLDLLLLLYLVLERRDTLYLLVHGGFGISHTRRHFRGTGRRLDDGRGDGLEGRARCGSVHARVGEGNIPAGDRSDLAARVLKHLLGKARHDRSRLELGGGLADRSLLDNRRGCQGLEAVLRQERLEVWKRGGSSAIGSGVSGIAIPYSHCTMSASLTFRSKSRRKSNCFSIKLTSGKLKMLEYFD